MDGVHDLGGRHNFGPVQPEADEPLFHADWEARVLALTLATGGLGRWNLDQMRFLREALPPVDYLSSSYYEIWARALENALVRAGLVDADELASGRPGAVARDAEAVPWAAVAPKLRAGGPTTRPAEHPARFAVGDRVRTVRDHPAGHTRLPGYARGTPGIIERVHGAHVFPDRHAANFGRPFDQRPEWLYTVVFDGPALWGAQGGADLRVSIDAWEPYLEPGEDG